MYMYIPYMYMYIPLQDASMIFFQVRVLHMEKAKIRVRVKVYDLSGGLGGGQSPIPFCYKNVHKN
jgi:hypothetical protein